MAGTDAECEELAAVRTRFAEMKRELFECWRSYHELDDLINTAAMREINGVTHSQDSPLVAQGDQVFPVWPLIRPRHAQASTG